MRKRFLVGLGLVFVAIITSTVSASLMHRTETVIAVPEPGQEIPLDKLVYKARFEAKVHSVRLELQPKEGAGQLQGKWIFTGSNTDGQIHRLEIKLRLRDESGKQIAFFSARHVLAAGARDQKFSLPMNVPEDVWRAGKSVHIVVDWIT